MSRLLAEMSAAPDFSLNFDVTQTAIVADDIGMNHSELQLNVVISYVQSLYE
jgi:hypothetical protein